MGSVSSRLRTCQCRMFAVDGCCSWFCKNSISGNMRNRLPTLPVLTSGQYWGVFLTARNILMSHQVPTVRMSPVPKFFYGSVHDGMALKMSSRNMAAY